MATAMLPHLPSIAGFVLGVVSLLLVLRLTARIRPGTHGTGDVVTRPRSFRFRNGYLVEHSDNVGFLLPEPLNRLTAWRDLQAALRPIAPGCGAAFKALSHAGTAFTAEGRFGEDRLRILGHRDGDDLCIGIVACDVGAPSICVDRTALEAIEAERAFLAVAADTSPSLSWRIDTDGTVIWANSAYRATVARSLGADAARGWPIHALFPGTTGSAAERSRRKCSGPDLMDHWFDVTLSPPASDGTRAGHAISLDAFVTAEDALRGSLQALTRGFAQLPVGLAIFGADGRLMSFNPQLIDLSGLDAAWLSRRPSMTDVFARLRTRQDIPAPAGFAEWCAAIAGGAGAAPHTESWSGSDATGRRLTARPQSDGSLTLVIEDTSGAIAGTILRDRHDATVASLLDATDQGFVLFDAAGRRGLVNEEAQRLWLSGRAQLPDTLGGCLTFWRMLCRATPLWGEIRDLSNGTLDAAVAWDEAIVTQNGTQMKVRVLPLPDGALALAFAGPDSRIPALPLPLPVYSRALTA